MKQLLLMAFATLALTACNQPQSKNRAVFLLLDTSGTYTEEIDKAEAEQWKKLGLGADAAGYWRCYGFDPAETGKWLAAGFLTASQAAAWSLRGFSLEEAVELHNAGTDASQACRERSRSA